VSPGRTLDNTQALLVPGLGALQKVVAQSRVGGSTVLSAANIHPIARARAFASSRNSCAKFKQTVRKLLSKIGVSVRPAGDGGFRAI